MSRNIAVNVEFLTRVEGHGHIVVDVKDGQLQKAQLQIVESPRFFEAMLHGRSVFEAQHITSRICGICACAHSLASLQAAEDALGVIPSEQTLKLRKLLLYLENLDSHILHIYLLAAPDLFGVQSFLGMLPTHGDAVRRALRMKKHCNDICDILVGRHVHPITAVIGGFTRLPEQRQLGRIRELLLELQADVEPTVELIASLDFPKFWRETEYVALVSDRDEFPLLTGELGSTYGVRKSKHDYRAMTNEFLLPHSTAKHARLSRSSYAVGALARFNLNFSKLHPAAKTVAARIGLQAPCCNPYLNTAAQLVESVHCIAESLQVVEDLLDRGLDYSERILVGSNENHVVPVRSGSGVGAVEAPRGLLFHHYQLDEQGIIQKANCVIPTGQNLQNIEDDMQQLVPELLDRSEQEVTQALEMLVRAYDPCISCSTHFLKVDFVGR